MAITFKSATPQALLNAFKKAIDEKHVVTWTYDSDGDFTHTVDQWKNKAYLRPSVEAGQLVMRIVGSRNVVTTWSIYAVYHGRFIESMITHGHDLFTSATASSKPTALDIITDKVA